MSFIPEYLQTFYDEISPLDFYRVLFPVGSFELKGKQVKGGYNGIAVEIIQKKDEVSTKRYIITDELETLKELLKSENFVVLSPFSYAGKTRESKNARFIYALAIDLDGIKTEQNLRDLFFQIKNEILPKPSFIVSSGTGIHLYYKFEEPLPCFENIVKELAKLKKALTKKIWNKYVTTLYDKPQIESLFQGFRLVGGITKDGKRTKAFEVGETVTVEYLNNFVAEEHQAKFEQIKKGSLSLEEAKKRFPEWYERRIIEKQKKQNWVCKRDLFDWWVRQIKSGATVGHRYFCIMVLAIYAKKSGIEREELEKTAFDLLQYLDGLTETDENHFTAEDVFSALEAYSDNYITFPIDSISSLTNIEIKKNKRNYRRQDVHLKIARANKAILKAEGLLKKDGRPSKEKEVKEWLKANPNGRKVDCIRETGVSRSAVDKYWD